MPYKETDDPFLEPETNYRDVSGPLNIAVEVTMVLVNILPILVVCKFKHFKDKLSTDELVVALSLTDILSVIVPSPLGLMAYFTHKWYGGERTCEFYQLTTIWFQLASMCLITYMCIDRFMTLRRALNYKVAPPEVAKIRGVVFGIYLFTLIVVCLPVMGLAPKALSGTGQLCESWILAIPRTPKEHTFYIIFLVIGYTNLILAVFINTSVIVSLWTFQKRFGSKSTDRRLNSMESQIDKKTLVEFTLMILIVTIVFHLAWLPTLMMITLQKAGFQVNIIAVMYALLSTTLTGLLNPAIYGIFSGSYRRAYKKIGLGFLRLVFGCPIQRIEILDDVSTQAKRMRATVSNTNSGNSISALLQRGSVRIASGSNSELQVYDSNYPAYVNASISACEFSHESELLNSPVHGTFANSRLDLQQNVAATDIDREDNTSELGEGMQERTYCNSQENSYDHDIIVNNEGSESDLSLLCSDSELSEFDEDSPSHNLKPPFGYNKNHHLQESMI